MILGLGLDVVPIARIRSLRERHGERFLGRVFGQRELETCLASRAPDLHLAGRFAAKEAGMKALGTGWGSGVGWQDVQVVSAPAGAPRLELSGGAAERAATLGVSRCHVSLTHDGGTAAAVVVLEGDGPVGTGS